MLVSNARSFRWWLLLVAVCARHGSREGVGDATSQRSPGKRGVGSLDLGEKLVQEAIELVGFLDLNRVARLRHDRHAAPRDVLLQKESRCDAGLVLVTDDNQGR